MARQRSGDSPSAPGFDAPSCPPVIPTKSPYRSCSGQSSLTSASSAVHQRQTSLKIRQITGLDMDLFSDTLRSCEHSECQLSPGMASSEIDALGIGASTSESQTRHSLGSEEYPGLEDDADEASSRYTSWTSRSPPQLIIPLDSGLDLDESLPDHAATADRPHLSLAQSRLKHHSMDEAHVMDDYHQFVAQIASPKALSPRISTPVPPATFAEILVNPRPAPRPPQPVSRPVVEERQGSFFDFDSSSDGEDGAETHPPPQGRSRDSFMGIFLRRSGSGTRPPRSSSSAELGRPCSESTTAQRKEDTRGKHGHRRAFWSWTQRDVLPQAERRREELKQKITVQGGRRL